MALIKLLGIIWLILTVIFAIGLIVGYQIENRVSDDHPVKKWWRKNIVANDPDDNFWKNFNG